MVLEDPVSLETIGTVYKKYKCCILEKSERRWGRGLMRGS